MIVRALFITLIFAPYALSIEITNENIRSYVNEWCTFNNNSIQTWDTSKVTNMSALFANYNTCNPPIENWKTNQVLYMDRMFEGSQVFNRSLDRWNVSSVVDMSYMFFGTRAYNRSMVRWSTGSVRSMRGMFMDAKRFNQDIGMWNLSSVKDISYMFMEATAFNKKLCWNISAQTNTFLHSACPGKPRSCLGTGTYESCNWCEQSPKDVCFILDQSSSMSNSEDKLARGFIISIIERFFSSTTRLSLVSFSDRVYGSIGFNDPLATNKDQFIDYVNSFKRNPRTTNTPAGLNGAYQHFVNTSSSSTGREKIVILISDGQPNVGPNPVASARSAFMKLKNVTSKTVFIRIGNAIREDLFDHQEDMNLHSSTQGLLGLVSTILYSVCPEPELSIPCGEN